MKYERVEDYKPILSECYGADDVLISKWHTVQGLDECIEKEFKDLQDAKAIFFKVMDGYKLAGYFCKEKFHGADFLTGFFLMPEFRTKDLLSQYWNLIKAEFKSPFFCGLYDNNIPANKFIKARGGTEFMRTVLPDGPATYFKVGA